MLGIVHQNSGRHIVVKQVRSCEKEREREREREREKREREGERERRDRQIDRQTDIDTDGERIKTHYQNSWPYHRRPILSSKDLQQSDWRFYSESIRC